MLWLVLLGKMGFRVIGFGKRSQIHSYPYSTWRGRIAPGFTNGLEHIMNNLIFLILLIILFVAWKLAATVGLWRFLIGHLLMEMTLKKSWIGMEMGM